MESRCRRAKRSAPAPASRTCLPCSITSRAATIGFLMRRTAATPPARSVAPASTWRAGSFPRRRGGRSRSATSPFLRLAFSRAGLLAGAAIADHSHGLDLDLDAGAREVAHRDQRAAGIVAVLEHVLAHLDEAVAVARFLDEHGHRHHVGQAAAGAL